MKQQGFMLPTLLLLLVIASLVTTNTMRLRALADQTHTQSLLSAKAYYAAQAALEWVMAEIDINNLASCPADLAMDGADVSAEGFSVVMDCDLTTHTDSGRQITVFYLTADATYNNPGERHFTSRHLELTYQK